MDVREKLVELLREAPYNIFGNKMGNCYFDSCLELIADHLIANGVTIGNSHRAWRIDDYGVTGKNGPICGCPKCGGCSSIVWDPVTDTNTCTCGWTDSTNNVTVQGWISVKDGLPEEDKAYLVTTNDFGSRQGVYIRWFAKDGETVDEYELAGQKCVWYFYDSEYGYVSTNSVTHWMPLPYPPKGE